MSFGEISREISVWSIYLKLYVAVQLLCILSYVNRIQVLMYYLRLAIIIPV